MRKIVYTLFLTIFAASACQNGMDEGSASLGSLSHDFVAMTESAPDSKSMMTQDPERGGVYNVKWVRGDEILVSDGTTSAMYFAFPQKDATLATLTSIESALPAKGASAYYAVYPALEGAMASSQKCTVIIPVEQKYGGDNLVMPMLGRAGKDRILTFKNAAALIRVKPSNHCDVYDGVKVSRIEVSSSTMNIAGPIDYTFDGSGVPVVASTQNGSSTVVLDCGEGLPFSEDFFIAVAPGTYGDLNVTVRTNGGGHQTFVIDEKEYKRSNYTTVSPDINNLAIYEPANCYLVRQPGTYKFPVNVKGNGVLVPGSTITSADIDVTAIKGISVKPISQLDLKMSQLSADYTLTDVVLSDGYITFNVPSEFVSGNIRIGIYSTEDCTPGTCIWQWHIWANPDVSEVATSGVRLMNMNVGSLQTISNLYEYAGTNAGLHYQWGRKDPFHAAVIADSEDETLLTEIQPGLGYSVDENCTDATEHRSTVANSISYPTVLYTGKYLKSGANVRQAWNHGDETVDLWGAPAVSDLKSLSMLQIRKTMFDPCPPGYHVADAKALADARDLLPPDGYRIIPNDSKANERLQQLGEQKYYWTASSSSATTDGMNALSLANGSLSTSRTKSYAMPIRPQKQ